MPPLHAGEEERLRALRMLGVLQQPVGHQFGSITRSLKCRWPACWRLGGEVDAACLVLRFASVCASTALHLNCSPSFSIPLATRSLLKLIFDVPLAQAFLIDEDASYGVPNSPSERWAAYPRW